MFYWNSTFFFFSNMTFPDIQRQSAEVIVHSEPFIKYLFENGRWRFPGPQSVGRLRDMDFFLTPFSATGAIGYSFFIFHILSVSSTGESLQRRLMEECLHKQSRKVVISNGVWQAIRSFPFGLSEDKSPSPNIWPIISLAVLSLKPSLMMFRRQWSSCIHAILL